MKGKVFTVQEVQAIIAGDKTQFREVIKGAELEIFHPAIHSWAQSPNDHKFYAKAKNNEVKQQYVTTFPFHGIKCPYQVGQKIFCKESFGLLGPKCPVYLATINPCLESSIKWKPAKHMKQEHSRLTLQIKSISVERLGDVSEGDAKAEGVDKLFTEEEMKHVRKLHPTEKNNSYKNYLWHGHIGKTITRKQSDEWTYQYSAYEKAKDSFVSLWNATHRKLEEKFEASPWVWKVDFEIIKYEIEVEND